MCCAKCGSHVLKILRTLSIDGSLADEHLGAVVAVDEGGLQEHGLFISHGAAVPGTPAPAPTPVAAVAAAVVAALVLLSRRVQEVRGDERGLRIDLY